MHAMLKNLRHLLRLNTCATVSELAAALHETEDTVIALLDTLVLKGQAVCVAAIAPDQPCWYVSHSARGTR